MPLRFREEHFIDATFVGNRTKFVNHHDTPNSHAVPHRYNGERRICFITCKRVEKDEELTFDYGKKFFTDKGIFQEINK